MYLTRRRRTIRSRRLFEEEKQGSRIQVHIHRQQRYGQRVLLPIRPSLKILTILLLISLLARDSLAFIPSLPRRKALTSDDLLFHPEHLESRNDVQCSPALGRTVLCPIRLYGKGMAEYDDDEEEDDDDDIDMTEKQNIGSNEDDLQRRVEEQQKQIDLLINMMKEQQQQTHTEDAEEQEKKEKVKKSHSILPSVQSTFSKNYTPEPQKEQPQQQRQISSRQPQQQQWQRQHSVATASVSPLKAMIFIDGTWLYYSIHERNEFSCPIIQKYGMGWQRKYYFDWTALPRVICQALQDQDLGWAVQARPVEIVRASVFTSYKADTSPQSYRFRMYQDMANANYDVHMMETIGKNEKCVDIQIAVEMLHYATVPNAYDVALLLTGDKDFIPAMIRTRQKGRRVGLVSMRSGCNRVLFESPSDDNDNSEHNHNIRDYDVVWIEDYLDELIKPKRGVNLNADDGTGENDNDSAITTSFTMMKVVSDFISKSGFNQVSSRDIGRYLKLMKIGDDTPPRSILDELKFVYGGLYQFFTTSVCFEVIARGNEAREADPNDKSYWVGFRGDADMTLVKAAREAKLSPAEKKFFDEYSLDALDDRENWYRHTMELAKLENLSPRSLASSVPPVLIPPDDYDKEGSNGEELEIPEELRRDYSEYTVPRLKDYCRDHGLKVSGTKSQLLDRIREFNDQEITKLESEFNASRQVQNRQGTAPSTSAKDGDSSSDSGSAQGYLIDLVAEYVKAAGGQANSRDMGRYLAANKASPSRLAMAGNQTRISALQELKERHGSLVGFILDNPRHFEKREIDANSDQSESLGNYAFYVALAQQTQPRQEPPQPQTTEATR